MLTPLERNEGTKRQFTARLSRFRRHSTDFTFSYSIMTQFPVRSAFTLAALALLGYTGSPASAVTVSSAPFGVIVADTPVGKTGFSFPLIADDVFAGAISGNSEASATFAGMANVGSRLTAGTKYYLEITSGALEGERFDIDTAGSIATGNGSVALDLSTPSFSTLGALTADALAGAHGVIRPHVTLAKIATMFSPALVGNNSLGQADSVAVMTNTGIVFYYLRSDNQTWREPGKTTDLRNLVIPPDVSVLVQLRSGAKTFTHSGVVRTNAFRKNLNHGIQGFATGYPVDMSPVQIGAFSDGSLASELRWVGSADTNSADSIKVFDTQLNDFRSYQLAADGVSWILPPDTTNLASSPILKSPAMIVVSRNNPDPAYVIAPPFTP